MEKSNVLAITILGVMFFLMLFSAWNDSAIMDEMAHIPASYSYVAKMDYRLNPEHPPLIKDIAGLPLLFLRPNFPTDTDAWTKDVNGQWTQGAVFLYESGNNPDSIIFWSRLPVILLAILMGWIIYRYLKKRYNEKIALMTLVFFAFSPTFLAHSRFVTTDLAASFGFLIGILGLVIFLENPSFKNVIFAGALFGIAQLLKFSLFLLFPIYIISLLIWLWVERPYYKGLIRFPFFVLQKTVKVFLVFTIGGIVIYLVYAWHVLNYPAVSYKPDGKPYLVQELTQFVKLPEPERSESIRQIPISQMRDTIFTLSSFAGGPDPEGFTCDLKADVSVKRRIRCLAEFTIWATDKPFFRPIAQYLLGVEMVIQRSAGGNTAYFLGEVSAAGWKHYFPMLYLFKETLAFHLLTLAALLAACWRIIRGNKSIRAIRDWIHENPFEFSSFFFIAFYWAYSMKSPLNIGVRHVLPTFPFIYFLVAKEINGWFTSKEYSDPQTWAEWLKKIFKVYIASIPKTIFVGAMVIWIIISQLWAFPSYLSYFNELAGGSINGYKFAVDSNYDWGQDLKRLQKYARDHRIKKIAVDYFGGGSPRYYLGNAFEPWWSSRGKPEGYFAISATFLQGAHGKAAQGFVRKPEDDYEWLKPFRPIDRAGESIFIYKMP